MSGESTSALGLEKKKKKEKGLGELNWRPGP
jgi:hypothetical protein